MTMGILAVQDFGGIQVAPGSGAGMMVARPGQVQYGVMLLGGGTSARWKNLTAWRDLPSASVADSQRPQAHGTYPGSVFGDSLTVTFDYLIRGTFEERMAALAAIEQYAPMDGIERPLVIDDGDGPWMRMARVTARTVPQDHTFKVAPLACSMQFLCADPRRYALDDKTIQVRIPSSSGGINYPITYPLEYGTFSGGGGTANNAGAVATPVTVTFTGPLNQPALSATNHHTWAMGFDINLAAGETLVVDTADGTALLNGTADRLYTITSGSDPLERCTLNPGNTSLSLLSASGTGYATVSYRDARM
ncbi:Phage tail protein [Nocardioides sp. YR527]|uniref:phage distal tail protein n=1 Tax=Nocardioides sp. YR527 TaxID=1881028 RepID=UPI000885A7B2|nr:phage tail family protein [Nocardioides sp. YR527]SDL14294.1 Phage tail protein [Nocardioides sp. YR527]